MAKIRFFLAILATLFALHLSPAYAQQNHDDGLDEVCALSEGSWHTSASGWACCWSNWGCYGCTNGNCLMNCRTPRCKRMNGIGKSSQTELKVQGLAPRGMKAPIVPLPRRTTLPPEVRESSEQINF